MVIVNGVKCTFSLELPPCLCEYMVYQCTALNGIKPRVGSSYTFCAEAVHCERAEWTSRMIFYHRRATDTCDKDLIERWRFVIFNVLKPTCTMDQIAVICVNR